MVSRTDKKRQGDNTRNEREGVWGTAVARRAANDTQGFTPPAGQDLDHLQYIPYLPL